VGGALHKPLLEGLDSNLYGFVEGRLVSCYRLERCWLSLINLYSCTFPFMKWNHCNSWSQKL
jgi:hypothetical protein